MADFTKGKWWIAPPIFDGDVIYAPQQTKGRRNEVIAMGILNKADAHLIAVAPEMYAWIDDMLDYLAEFAPCDCYELESLKARGRELRDRINGKMVKNSA